MGVSDAAQRENGEGNQNDPSPIRALPHEEVKDN